MGRSFTAEIRIFLCEACGAPLDAPLVGGQFVCGYCRANNAVARRDERATLGIPAAPQPIDEAERSRRLRMQDGQPLVAPTSVLEIVPNGVIEPWRLQEVFAVFQATRKEIRATHSPEASERLYFLAIFLGNHLSLARDDTRLRAVLETALDTLTLPRHRQVLRGLLSRNAVREGDREAAERWLAPCDPRSDDLISDSSYRISRAFIDTALGNFPAVLALLGAAEDAVPIADTMDEAAVVLRANAIERMGDVAAAAALLQSRMADSGAAGRAALSAFITLAPALRLCEHSLPKATAGHSERAAARAGAGTTLLGGGLFVLGLGLLFTAVALGASVAVGGGLLARAVHSPGALVGTVFSVFGAMLGPGIPGLLLTPLGALLALEGRRSRAFRRIARPAHGTVKSIEATGVRVNRSPVHVVTVMVEVEGGAPYAATVRMTGTPGFGVGARVPLLVHPTEPQRVELESD